MKLLRMTATFAALEDASLVLSPGLNLIEAPNEAGKSTWCAFLRAMLYGLPTRERDRQDYIAEKNRYQPWSGRAMEGTVDLLWRGEEITLRRGPKGSVPFGAFSAVYTRTGQAVPGLTGENCGEILLGVSREVYERTAFVGQGKTAIGESPELEQRIASLVSSGEEEVSYSRVDQRLRDWLNRRKFNKSGLIPKLENELAVLDDTLARQADARRRAEAARQDVARLSPRQEALSTALAAWRSREMQDRQRIYDAAQAELVKARAEVDALRASLSRYGEPPDKETLLRAQEQLAELKALQANLKEAQARAQEARDAAQAVRSDETDPLFPGMDPEQARQKARADADAALKRSHAPLNLLLCGLLSLLCGVGCVLLSLPAPLPGYSAALYAAGGLFLLAALLFLFSALKRRKHTAQRRALLAGYGVSSPQEILSAADAFARRADQAREAHRRAGEAERTLEELSAKQEALSASLLELVHTFEPAVSDLFGVSAAISRALSLRDKLSAALIRLEGAEKLAQRLPKPELSLSSAPPGLSHPQDGFDPVQAQAELTRLESELSRLRTALAAAEGELGTLGDPLLFESRRQELTEELARRQEEYAALQLARDCLAQADREMQKRFSPALNTQAGAILAALTGGRYDRLTLSRSFDAAAGDPPRRTLLLSRGTGEQIYLAVRLAVCRLALPQDETAPIVLDDALADFDDARMALALRFLLDLSRERQILLFTCHSREGRALAGQEGVSFLTLGNL